MVSRMRGSLTLLLQTKLSEAPGTAPSPSDWPGGTGGRPPERGSRRPTLFGQGRRDMGLGIRCFRSSSCSFWLTLGQQWVSQGPGCVLCLPARPMGISASCGQTRLVTILPQVHLVIPTLTNPRFSTLQLSLALVPVTPHPLEVTASVHASATTLGCPFFLLRLLQ